MPKAIVEFAMNHLCNHPVKATGKLFLSAIVVVSLVGFAHSAFGESKGGKKGLPSPSAVPPPSFTARTQGVVKKQGLIEAAGTKWSCRNNACTATAPFPPINVASCQAIRAVVGNIAALGDGKNFLSADDLQKCNAAPSPSVIGTTSPGSVKAPGAAPLGGAAAAPPPALARQLTTRNEGFRKAQAALAEQRRRADAEAAAAEASTGAGGGGDFTSRGDDCDDHNASVHPGTTEVCNLIDDNCNGEVDERVLATFYLDADGDTHGDPARAVEACAHQIGSLSEGAYLVPVGNDCDDSNPDRWHDC